MSQKKWTDDEIEYLKSNNYLPASKISEKIERTASSVKNKRLRMKLKSTYNTSVHAPYGEITSGKWRRIESKSILRGYEFKITIEEAWDIYLKQNKKCALTGKHIGFEYNRDKSGGKRVCTASLDRIDALKGYFKENCQWVHKDVNFAKQSMTNEQFINLCKEVVNYNESQSVNV